MAEPIETLLTRHEDKTLEFKLNLSAPDRAIATLVAFANSAGGTLVIGVEDGTRAVAGLSNPTEVEEKLANLVADRISPTLLVDISVVPWRSTYLIVVEVYPSQLRPHFVRGLGLERGTLVRIGSSNRIADDSLRADLARELRTTFDETPMLEATDEPLDASYAAALLQRGEPLSDVDFVSLRALDRSRSGLIPTVGGYLLFRSDQEPRLMPDAWVQAGRFVGTDRTEIADSKRINGRLIELVDRSMEFLDRSLDNALRISGRGAHESVRPVPAGALREAVVNAVVHADYRQQGGPIRIAVYSDRVEIENPGLLLPGLTVDDLFAGTSRLRNRMIGRIFAERGYIEQWGSGVRRMVRECREAGKPVPYIEELPSRIRVTFRFAQIGEQATTTREAIALKRLSTASGTSSSELSVELGVSDRTARTILARLVARGLAVVIGSSPTDPHRRYHATGNRTA